MYRHQHSRVGRHTCRSPTPANLPHVPLAQLRIATELGVWKLTAMERLCQL